MMEGQARSSGLVMGFDNHLIAGSRACSTFSPAHSPDYHQPDKPALCRGPGRDPPAVGALLPVLTAGRIEFRTRSYAFYYRQAVQ
jgi:hypothetical protein